MSKELLSRLKPELLLAQASRAVQVAAYNGITIDTQKLIATAQSDMYDNPQNLLVLISISSFGGSGTIDLNVRHKNDNEDFVSRGTLAQMTQASGQTLFLAEVKNFRRFIRIDSTVGTATSAFQIIGILGHSRGNPVLQSFTELALTDDTL